MLKILLYGFPSIPLASLYFSIYVLLGEFYFDNYGLSLSMLVQLLLLRLIDAFSDPIMGYISDNFISKYGKRKPWVIIGGTIFVFQLGFSSSLYLIQ